MPQLQPITFDEVKVGSASSFRGTINSNFDKIRVYFDNLNIGNGIIVSSTQPAAGDQVEGDMWFRVL